MTSLTLSLVVPKELVKTVKSRLEQRDLLDKKHKIAPYIENEEDAGCFIIHTTTSAASTDQREKLSALLSYLDLELYAEKISIITSESSSDASSAISKSLQSRNPILSALSQWLDSLPPEHFQSVGTTTIKILSEFPSTYNIYEPMLLLPAHTFKADSWMKFANTLDGSAITRLYEVLAAATNTTHIAINASIPLSNKSHAQDDTGENILRSPSNLTPLYGSFGPPPISQTLLSPTAQDFDNAVWVSTVQNGIFQTWSPLYTMFSRGNIKEKARLLHLKSIVGLAEEWSAVDLYSGIGYFAFSYARAGASSILCWEFNPWSVEGMLRGIKRNKWSSVETQNDDEGRTTVAIPSDTLPTRQPKKPTRTNSSPQFFIFQESNTNATHRLRYLRPRVPPIRHVNLGLLPTSSAAYGVAVEALDAELGGWLHVHENISSDASEMQRKVEIVLSSLRTLVEQLQRGKEWNVQLEHVEKVKTYAPGVLHCVLDVWVGP